MESTKQISRSPFVSRILPCVALLLFSLLLPSSCSRYEGWGVLRWGSDEYGIAAGTVLPIYIKSNIDSVWITGSAPKGPGLSRKVEFPLWQVEFFSSKGKAEKRAAAFGEYVQTYAETLLDGLPLRAEPDGISRQTYRLRLGQTVKILSKAKGVAPSSGGSPLPGSWLLVMTDDGASGYCFSYRLRLYEHSSVASGQPAAQKELAVDEELALVLSRSWYPESYGEMVKNERIDLSRFTLDKGLFVDRQGRRILLKTDEASFEKPFTGIVEVSNGWAFIGSGVELRSRSPISLQVLWKDARGKKQKCALVSFPMDGKTIVAAEQTRRENLYQAIYRRGPVLKSSGSGTLSLTSDARFSWTGWTSGAGIPEGAGSVGSVTFDLYLPENLRKTYDGVLSLRFDALGKGKAIHYLYILESGGLTLEPLSPSCIEQELVKKRDKQAARIVFTRMEE